MKKKARIDQTLVERGFFERRERAQRAIMAGEVRVGSHVFAKQQSWSIPMLRFQLARHRSLPAVAR